MNGAKNMLYMQSINGDDGTMTLQVSFEVGTDVDLDQVQVQNRLSQATSSLPNAVNNYGLTTQQTVGIPLLVFSITRRTGPGTRPSLRTTSRSTSRTSSRGFPESARSKFSARRTTRCGFGWRPTRSPSCSSPSRDITNAISAQNVVNPAGTIGGEPAPPGQQVTYTVRAQGRLMNADEFGNIILRANPDGSLVRLKDVARIELGTENYNEQAYTNGLAVFGRRALPEPRLQRAGGARIGRRRRWRSWRSGSRRT